MKNLLPLLSILIVGFMLMPLSSCKDDEPPAKAKISFVELSRTVNEDDDIIEIEVQLDKPASQDIQIEYELDGTAQDELTSNNSTPAGDYEIVTDVSDHGEIDIPQGETTGIIEIQLYSDVYLEDPEMIEIDLLTVNSDQVELTRDDHMEITLEQEDGLVIVLDWENVDADLDLIVRIGETVNSWLGFITASLSTSIPEFVFIPKNVSEVFLGTNSAAFGLSFQYYAGDVDPLDFNVTFIELIGGELEPLANRETFTAQYTIANLNESTDIETTKVAQTFQIVGTNWTSISDIIVPSTGSRMDSQPLPSTPLKVKGFKTSQLQKRY